MKKFYLPFILSLFLPLAFLFSCEKKDPLSDALSELRLNIYYSETDTPYKLKATYGFKEDPLIKDGIKSACVYALTFEIINAPIDAVTRTVTLTHGGKTYSGVFGWNYVQGCYSASVPLSDFSEKTFSIGLFIGAEKTDTVMSSAIPDGTLDHKGVLDKLKSVQPTLINSYYGEDGAFNAEITARVLVKNEKPYWYIAITDRKPKTKAFLMDGKTGELLAIREIF